MPSIWKELLFLHGHVADVGLARRLAGSVPEPDARHTRNTGGSATMDDLRREAVPDRPAAPLARRFAPRNEQVD